MRTLLLFLGTVLCAVILWVYDWALLPSRRPLRQRLILFAAVCAAWFVLRLPGSLLLSVPAFVAGNYLLLRLGFVCDRHGAAFHAGFLTFAYAAAAVLTLLGVEYFQREYPLYSRDAVTMVWVPELARLSILIAVLLISGWALARRTGETKGDSLPLLCAAPLLSLLCAGLLALFALRGTLTGPVRLLLATAAIFLVAFNLLFLLLYSHLRQGAASNTELALSLQKERADLEYYRTLQQEAERQRILVHDMRKHLNTVRALAAERGAYEIEDYVNSILPDLQTVRAVRFCDDPILNVILQRAASACRERGIGFSCDVRGGVTAFLDPASVTTLYGNLLDNALEAAETSVEKQVWLRAIRDTTAQSVVVTAVNSCDRPPERLADGSYRSRKGGGHGLGLRGIARVVRRFHGVSETYYDPQERRFHHVIQFPVQAERTESTR